MWPWRRAVAAAEAGQAPSPVEGAAAALTEAEAPHAPWWARLRWRPTSRTEAVASERALLAQLRHPWTVADVAVPPQPQQPGGSGPQPQPKPAAVREHFLHVTSGGKPDAPTLVLMPGYGAGTGFFFRNLDGLAAAFRIFAVDWLGTGLSGRPPFTAVDRASAEAFFLESLNAWRAKAGLKQFILVGHSLGGYLAASYALRHPEQVQHLVLVGPAGIPAKPEGWESRFLSDPWSMRAQLYKLAASAWMAGLTPGSLVRGIGPWGPKLVGGYVSGRFSMHGMPLSQEERDVFKDYFYHIAAQRGSGEFALRHLLAPGAWAHAPLQQRLAELVAAKVPLTLIYGEHDWMNPAAGEAVAAELDTIRQRKVPSDHTVERVPDSGHFVFMEQPELFNAALLRATASYLPPGVAERLVRAEAAAREAKLAALRAAAQQQQRGAGAAPDAP